MKAAIFFILTATMLALISVPITVYAGDASTLNILGSSNDGRYLAYEQYGSMDGSGSPFSIISVHDLTIDQPVLDGLIEGSREGEPRNLATVRRDALSRADLTKWEIELGRTGTPLVQHLLTDVLADEDYVSFTTSPPLYGMAPEEYSLRLKTHPTGQECLYGYGKAHVANLTLFNWAEATRTPWGDQIAPPRDSRCALDYRIQEIRLLPGSTNHLLVFLNVFHWGFEGHDMRFMLVSGEFE